MGEVKRTMSEFKRILLIILGLFYRRDRSQIIFYHDLHDGSRKFTDMSTSIDLFDSHVECIEKKGLRIVKDISQKEGEIQICFDDGFRGVYENKEYFLSREIFPTIFVAIDLIGSPGYMTRDEILELYKLGFNFGSHGVSHRKFTSLRTSELKDELSQSKEYLEQLLGIQILGICFPIGSYSVTTISLAKSEGYKYLYSSLPGAYELNETQNEVVFRNLVQHASGKEFEAILDGAMELLRPWYKRKHVVKIR